jgi:hypothetical protein
MSFVFYSIKEVRRMIPINKYPYTDLHEMNMDWVLEQIKQLTEAWAQTQTDWSTMQEDFATLSGQFTDLKNYVDTFFDNLDLQQEVNNKLGALRRAIEKAETL